MAYTSTIGGIWKGAYSEWLWANNPYYKSEPAPTYNITINFPPPATPVTPTFDPKIDANALYGKPMALFVGGFARIGASPAPIVGPDINSGLASFIVSFGVPANPDGDRKIYAIYLDQELAWSSVTGGTTGADGTYHVEPFDFVFRPGRLDQDILPFDEEQFPGDGNAYRPQMLLQISLLPIKRWMDLSGKPIPYVACDIGDVTDGADPYDGINLGTALERIAHSPWAGYTSDTFEAVNITDVVPAILIKDNFTVVQLCQSVTRIYRNIDLLQSDKLRIKDRGNLTPDFVFDRDSIIGGEGAVQIVRAGATAQRRELELITVDPDQDYTAVPSLSKIPRDPFVISAAVGKETITSPLVMNASTRQALVTFAHQYEENARKKVAFKVRAVGYEIEPGDLFAISGTVAAGVDGEVFKCTQTVHGANFVVEIEGEAVLRCAISVATTDPDFASLVLLLHCNGAVNSTSFTDSSSYANTVTAVGNAKVSALSKFGSGAVVLDGTGDGLSAAIPTLAVTALSATNTSPYTIECWANFTSLGTQALVAMDGGAFGRFFRLWQNGDDEIRFSWAPDGNTYQNIDTSGADITTGTYIHCVADKDSTGKIRIYVGGVMKASDTPADSTIGLSLRPITVGSTSLLAGLPFSGYIDDVRVYRGVSKYGDVYGDIGFTPPTEQFPDS